MYDGLGKFDLIFIKCPTTHIQVTKTSCTCIIQPIKYRYTHSFVHANIYFTDLFALAEVDFKHCQEGVTTLL